MSVKLWAIKPGELKPLDRAGVLLFGARCALRAAPWIPAGAADLHRALLHALLQAAVTGQVLPAALQPDRRALSDRGARACIALEASDEPRGRNHNYGAQVLLAALDAADAPERAAALKPTLLAARYVGSIAATWAHAGRVTEALGTASDPVDLACDATWHALRADLALIIRTREALLAAPDPHAALVAQAAPWPTPSPSWAAPPSP